MNISCRHQNWKMKTTFHAGMSFISGPIQLHTLCYMQRNPDRSEIAQNSMPV